MAILMTWNNAFIFFITDVYLLIRFFGKYARYVDKNIFICLIFRASNQLIKSLMKKTSFYLLLPGMLILIFLTFQIGCKKETNNDEYYVKYEVNSSTIYYGANLGIIINTETNQTTTFTSDQGGHWEVVIGPVQKGFNAKLYVGAIDDTHDKLKLYTNIYVSKNDSPFALKKSDGSDTPRDFVELNYTIDY
jgi:hypothetical protein